MNAENNPYKKSRGQHLRLQDMFRDYSEWFAGVKSMYMGNLELQNCTWCTKNNRFEVLPLQEA